MKKKLKIALLLGGIIGNTYGSNQVMSNENDTQTTGTQASYQSSSRPILAIAPSNILKSMDLTSCRTVGPSAVLPHVAVEPSLQEKINGNAWLISQTEAKVQEIRNTLASKKQDPRTRQEHKHWLSKLEKSLPLLNINRQLLVDTLERGDVPSETKNMFSVQNAASGGYQKRTIESLKKEAQQNCLGKVVEVHYEATAGSKQTVEMYPSPLTICPPKPAAPRSPIFDAGISWDDIVAEVESKFMLPPSMAEHSSRQKKPQVNDL